MNYFMKAFGYGDDNHPSSNPAECGGEQVEVVKNEELNTKDESTTSILSTIISSLSLGMDVFKSGISLPVKLHEPMTILQRSVEMMSEASLLAKADETLDPHSRLAYVVAYAISGFAGSERLCMHQIEYIRKSN